MHVRCLCVAAHICVYVILSGEGYSLTLSLLHGVVSSLFRYKHVKYNTSHLKTMRSPQVSHLLGCVWGKCAYSWVLAQTERAMKGWRREIGAEEDEDEEGCERGGVHIEGKTNYYPDNRQPMDFLPGLFCCSSSFCLFLFLPLCSRFKFQLRGALLT